MKTHSNFTRYIIDKNGDVFEKDNGIKVSKEKDGTLKLTTDEKFKSKITGRTTNIIRRFTPEEMIKIYNKAESLNFDIEEKKMYEEATVKHSRIIKSVQISKNDSDNFKIEIDGVKYKNTNQAAKELKTSVNTIKKRLEKKVDGYIYL